MALPQAKRYTFADLLTWDESERIELIDGDPVMMSPPQTSHQLISGELYRQIANYLKGKTCTVLPAPFGVRLFETDQEPPESVDTVVEPDVTIVCDRNKLDRRGCRGAPDMVAEVLSPATRRHDQLVKHKLYQQAGVREYWIVDPEKKIVLVHLLEEDGHYPSPDVYTEKDTVPVHVLEDCVIDLAEVFSF